MWGQIFRFSATGGANTAVDLALFALLVQAFSLNPAISNVLSYGTGIACSFVLNNWWTFEAGKRSGLSGRAVRFLAVSLSALLVSTVIVAGLGSFLSPLVAKLISIPLTFAWNFVLCRYFVFARGPERP
jgi:putative flippase GtrA